MVFESTFSLRQLIKASVEHVLRSQDWDGSFPHGHNGPYRDEDTPVRNTAHWLFSISRLISVGYKEKPLVEGAEKAAKYLTEWAPRVGRHALRSRGRASADTTNGIIGQAWAIEALIEFWRTSGSERALDTAAEIFHAHPWSEADKIWRLAESRGGIQNPDMTFNHQLWFAAIAASLPDPVARLRSEAFLDQNGSRPLTYKDGIIFHRSPVKRFTSIENLYSARSARDTARAFAAFKSWSKLRSKSIGYHAFNLYAYALLRQQLPDHWFWESPKWRMLLGAVEQPSFVSELEGSAYGWPYNPVGLELAYVFENFEPESQKATKWFAEQVQETGTRDALSPFGRQAADYWTSAARLYEATRLQGAYLVRRYS